MDINLDLGESGEKGSEKESAHGGRKILGEMENHGEGCDVEELGLPAAIKVYPCSMCSVFSLCKLGSKALIGNLRREIMEEALCNPFVLPANSSYGWRFYVYWTCGTGPCSRCSKTDGQMSNAIKHVHFYDVRDFEITIIMKHINRKVIACVRLHCVSFKA